VLGETSTMRRPAIMVWRTPDGFAWLEPSYYDPAPISAPAFHRITGTVEEAHGGLYLRSAEWTMAAALPAASNEDPELAAAITFALDRIAAAGSTLESERATLSAELADALA
jgi:hypothetical protein